jgi:hypothetical protein
MRLPGRMVPAEIVWRVRAITDKNSKEFADKLEKELNEHTKEGFQLNQMIGRESDKGLVLVFQKVEVQLEPEVGVQRPNSVEN